jgi:ATP-dependent Clp protease ATP-binding subunit ClpX
MPWLPAELFRALQKGVIGQDEALREVSVALCKHLNGVGSGNLLFIGSSGTGKTTLMRRVETVLAKAQAVETPIIVRINAALLVEDEAAKTETHIILKHLFEQARVLLGPEAPRRQLVQAVEKGIVFIDEIDKIRSDLGGRPNAAGVRAQESLLTLMEADKVLFPVAGGDGERDEVVSTARVLFVAGGAFDGLYNLVYRRMTVGADAGKLQKETVMTPWGQILERDVFNLRELWKTEDLFEYGISPQFIGRFEGIVFLNDLDADALGRILIELPDSVFQQSRNYFRAYGVDLQITPKALEILCAKAMENPRLGARALRQLFKTVIAPYEYEPDKLPELRPGADGKPPIFVLDEARVLKRLALQPA